MAKNGCYDFRDRILATMPNLISIHHWWKKTFLPIYYFNVHGGRIGFQNGHQNWLIQRLQGNEIMLVELCSSKELSSVYLCLSSILQAFQNEERMMRGEGFEARKQRKLVDHSGASTQGATQEGKPNGIHFHSIYCVQHN